MTVEIDVFFFRFVALSLNEQKQVTWSLNTEIQYVALNRNEVRFPLSDSSHGIQFISNDVTYNCTFDLSRRLK